MYERKRNVILSHATINKIMQLVFFMYDVTISSTNLISFVVPLALLTLAISPGPIH